MLTQEVEIQPNMRITLRSDNELLDEVVVVGYGTAKKVGTVIGAISTVSSEKIAEKPVINVMDALQGQIAGLQIYSNSGDPGDKGTASSYLRGVGSLTAVRIRRFTGQCKHHEHDEPQRFCKRNGAERCFGHFYLWFTCSQRRYLYYD